jgi:hypothetical protein
MIFSSSTTFKNFPAISGLLSEVPKFQHRLKVYSKFSNVLVSSLHLSPIYWGNKVFFTLNAAFAIAILDLVYVYILHHFLFITLPNQVKYSTFSGCLWTTIICTGDGCQAILVTLILRTACHFK